MNCGESEPGKGSAEGLSLKTRCIAFEGFRCIASGDLEGVARKAKELLEEGQHAPILIFDESSSHLIDIDFRGTVDEVMEKLRISAHPEKRGEQAQEKRGIGRPKLGVVAREVTLLPRHWEWLNRQPGGASVALRKLVEEARRSSREIDQARDLQESAHRFLTAVAGDLPGFEESLRALYAKDYCRFDGIIHPWPPDIRDHARKLVAALVEAELALPGAAG